MSTPSPTLLELDSRRRLTLGKLGRADVDRYLVTVEDDGTLILSPAVVLTEHEVALFKRPDILERIQANADEPSRRVTRKPRRNATS